VSDTPQTKSRALREKTTGVASPQDGCCGLSQPAGGQIRASRIEDIRQHVACTFGLQVEELNQRSTARAVTFPGQREMYLTKQSDFVVNPFVISFGAFPRLRRRHIHPFPRINCMKASIFFVI
jgi:hypothetical protein